MSPIPDGVSATTAWVDSHNQSKSFKIVCPYRSVRSSVSLYIGQSLGNNYSLANLPPRDRACHQFFLQCLSNFNYRVWHDFRTSQHIGGLEYIIRAKCCAYSQCYSFFNLTMLYSSTTFHFYSRTYGMIAASTVCSSACLRFYYLWTDVMNHKSLITHFCVLVA